MHAQLTPAPVGVSLFCGRGQQERSGRGNRRGPCARFRSTINVVKIFRKPWKKTPPPAALPALPTDAFAKAMVAGLNRVTSESAPSVLSLDPATMDLYRRMKTWEIDALPAAQQAEARALRKQDADKLGQEIVDSLNKTVLARGY
jgi:hypothetical protein